MGNGTLWKADNMGQESVVVLLRMGSEWRAAKEEKKDKMKEDIIVDI